MGVGRPTPSFGTAGRRPPPRFRSRSWHEHTRHPLAVTPRGRRLRRLRAEHPAGGRVYTELLARPEGISALAATGSPAAPIMIAGFLALALGTVAAGVALWVRLPVGLAGRIGAVLVVLAGLG